jgi:hypothetical protein
VFVPLDKRAFFCSPACLFSLEVFLVQEERTGGHPDPSWSLVGEGINQMPVGVTSFIGRQNDVMVSSVVRSSWRTLSMIIKSNA